MGTIEQANSGSSVTACTSARFWRGFFSGWARWLGSCHQACAYGTGRESRADLWPFQICPTSSNSGHRRGEGDYYVLVMPRRKVSRLHSPSEWTAVGGRSSVDLRDVGQALADLNKT